MKNEDEDEDGNEDEWRWVNMIPDEYDTENYRRWMDMDKYD